MEVDSSPDYILEPLLQADLNPKEFDRYLSISENSQPQQQQQNMAQ